MQSLRWAGLVPAHRLMALFFIMQTELCKAACDAYLRMCDMIGFLVGCSHEGHNITPDGLGTRIFMFPRACVDAGWKNRTHPKCHWLVHFPRHLRNHGFLVSCLVMNDFTSLASNPAMTLETQTTMKCRFWNRCCVRSLLVWSSQGYLM